MIFEGNHSVIEAIKEKKRLIDTGQPHDHIRPLLYQGGGLMGGVYGVGAALALEELGYSKVFTSMVGVSSGAPTIAHFAAGSTRDGMSILTEDFCDGSLVNLWRFWNQVDTKEFIKILRQDEKKRINFEKVFANPANIYFGVSEYETAEPKLLQPRDEDHLFDCIHASVNMQNVSPYQVIIDGVHYTDGGFTKPHMIDEVIKKVDATHVLIITNNDRDFSPIPKLERLLNRTLFRLRMNGILTQAINSRREERDKAISEALQSLHQVAVVWGDGSVGPMENNTKKVASAIEASRTWWHGLISLEK